MNNVQEAIKNYDKFRSKISIGFLNSTLEIDGLTAGIKLTDSQINIPFLSRDFFKKNQEIIKEIENHPAMYDNKEINESILKDFPELKTIFKLFEIGNHELIHAIQKHSYRSVFRLVDLLQDIESWENTLFFSHLSKEKKWEFGKSFLISLESIDNDKTREGVARYIAKWCKAVIKATEPKFLNIGIQHLIEGQALIASKLSLPISDIDSIDDTPNSYPELYTAAWSAFKEAGGKEPLVFVLIISAALRYGDIDDEEDNSSFQEFYPHPVDIYEYLLNFVCEIENIITISYERDKSSFLSKCFPDNFTLKYNKACQEIQRKVTSYHIKPKDSPHHSYLKCNIDEDDYDSEDEKIEFEEKLHNNIFCAFDPLSKKYYASSNRKSLIELSLHISKFISLIIESVYSRVAEPMKDEFCKSKNKKIADAVGSNFSEFLPDYYQEETLIRLFTDHEFEFIGKLMPYFCYEISENVYVKPFQGADKVSHGEYLLMRLMPELVIKLLQIYSWRFEEGDPPQLPYCCEKHGFISIDKASIEFFDSCDQEDSVGDSFKFMFNRSLNSVFE